VGPDEDKPFVSKPFISEQLTLTTQTPSFSDERPTNAYPGTRPTMVAFDTARQFLAVEQAGQVFGYYTENRGQAFQQVRIDLVGSNVHLAFEPSSQTLFACYQFGSTVRVRVSKTFGRTWNALSADVPAMVGGEPSGISTDCAIAPWRHGQAMLVTIDDNTKIQVRLVSDGLVVQEPELAFEQTTALVEPVRPAIATLPEDFVVHVGFTATRPGINDRDVYALYRDPTTGSFTPPMLLSAGLSRPQDTVAMLVDPATKGAVAAFVSEEPQPVVYLSVFEKNTQVTPAQYSWYSGAHLSVFVSDTVSGQTIFMKDKPLATDWAAYAPVLARAGNGKLYVAFSAGEFEVTSQNVFPLNHHVYVLPFDLARQPPKILSHGWFSGPGVKVGSARVARSAVFDQWPIAFAADPQLSFYTAFIEGLGTRAEVLNRPLFLSRP
jgi:hypothetical protein